MNRRDFFQFALRQARQTGKKYVSWQMEPVVEALDQWDASHWMEACTLERIADKPIFIHTGRRMVALLSQETRKASGEVDVRIHCLDALCPDCQSQVFWVPNLNQFRCPSCLTLFLPDGTPGEAEVSLSAWPIRIEQNKIFVAKG